ncbi:hypothetical protein THH46_05715 [Pseudomonas sp. NA13]
MILVDTNVLIDVLEDDPVWADWSIEQMRAQSKIHNLVINPVIYAELSQTFSTFEALDEVVEEMGLLMQEVPRPALFLAGKAFVRYRKVGGGKNNVLADFSSVPMRLSSVFLCLHVTRSATEIIFLRCSWWCHREVRFTTTNIVPLVVV